MGQGHRDGRNAETAGEARRRKPTTKMCSSAPEQTKYRSRRRDLIGQPECGWVWNHTLAHYIFQGQSIMKLLTHAGSSGVATTDSNSKKSQIKPNFFYTCWINKTYLI